MKLLRIFFIAPVFLSFVFKLQAQPETLPSEEARKAYENASEYLNRGDYSNAVMMYTQAIRLAPDNVMLRRDLAYAYFLSGNKDKAKEVIDPVVNSDFADEQTYQVASAIENSLGNSNKAEKIINTGLKRFPQSGILYNAKGNLAVGDGKNGNKNAIAAWQQGISADPSYYANYYNAAKYYYATNDPVWAAIYAEIYVNLDPNSAKTSEMKKVMMDAYRMLFSTSDDELPGFKAKEKSSAQSGSLSSFAKAYKDVMIKNGATISSGLGVENLIMLRTRFILDWNKLYTDRYFSTLFAYQDKLLRSGNFDCYNQWLFGATDDSQEFGIWVKNNADAYSRYEQWKQNNPLMPSVSDPKP